MNLADDDELSGLAETLPQVLSGLSRLLDDPPYNLFFHCAPADGKDYRHYHWHLEIIPRGEKAAGFEFSSGIYINTGVPEESTRQIREAMGRQA